MNIKDQVSYTRHPDDPAIDEVLFCGGMVSTYAEAQASAFLRLGLRERYKTSDLSGDEWRFSSVMQLRQYPTDGWGDVSAGYRDIETHTRFAYAELYGDFLAGKNEWLFFRKVHSIAFSWKGLPVWAASHDGAATDFLVACGHLPSALIQAGEQGQHHHGALAHLCCQPGCREPLVSVYEKRADWCGRCGGKKEPVWRERRGFCARHLRRGDCGLDDSDSNYIVISGPGPDGNEPGADVVSPSVRVNL
jgi:hypothetical protein